jgi:DNA repair protein REV1
MSLADDLQAVSVDEALIDVTSLVTQTKAGEQDEDQDPAKVLAESIRAQIKEVTGCSGMYQSPSLCVLIN